MGLHASVPRDLRTGKTVVGLFFEQVAVLTFGRDICGDWDAAIGREWLVTNGIGGYACGTIAGANTRRYHGFLIASLNPPVERTLMVAKVDIGVQYRGAPYHLSANEFSGGVVDPRGFGHLESFQVAGGIPIWRYALADALVEQRIFMAPGCNTSYLRLEVLRAGAPVTVAFKPLVTYRDHHAEARGPMPLRAVSTGPAACRVSGADGTCRYRLSLDAGEYRPADIWYWNFLHRAEADRGLDALEDLWGPGSFDIGLTPGAPVYFTACADAAEPPPGAEVHRRLLERSRQLEAAVPAAAPAWVRTLAVASDQFVVQRGSGGGKASIVAGYPWFADWGRDTMISLPGLTTTLGRHIAAAAILKTYAAVVDRGMLPNRFPDGGEAPEYNTADATLWLFHAVSEHLDARRDPDLLRELFPTLAAIIHAHADGTRFGIGLDPQDGLLRAGEPGTQLTWMDARQDGHAFTPRIGKPVEINALWLNALEVTMRLAGRLRDTGEKKFSQDLLERATQGFGRFWNEERGCLYDVLDVDGGEGRDARIRPNQIFAVALPYSALSPERMRAVVDTCARELLTSYGLRSLGAGEPGYVGRYAGNAWQRDGAYHQGTVWAWLLGPFSRAHHRVYGDAARAQAFLEPIAQHLEAACIGTVGEIFDGDAPHAARGCFAQAWSVAEILRSWLYLEARKSKTRGAS